MINRIIEFHWVIHLKVIEECQYKLETTDEDTSVLPPFDHATSKSKQKKLWTKHHKQPVDYSMNDH